MPSASSSVFLPLQVNVFVYSLAFWMIQPSMAFLSAPHGANVLGNITSLFAVLQLFGGAFLGRAADVVGPVLALNVSHVAASLSYLLLGLSGSSLFLIYLAQVPALFTHGMQSAQALAIRTSADEAQRSVQLGRLSLGYGLGMIVGAPLGGLLADGRLGHSGIALFASVVSLAVVPINAVLLPRAAGAPAGSEQGPSGWRIAETVKVLAASPAVRSIVAVQLLMGLAFASYRTGWALLSRDMGLDSTTIGFTQSLGGICTALTNSLAIAPLAKWFGSEDRLLVAAMAGGVLSFVGLPWSSASLNLMISLFLVPIAVCGSVMYTLMASKGSDASTEKGTVVALFHAVRSVTGSIAPALAGALYAHNGITSISVFCSLCAIASLATQLTTAPQKKKAT